MLHRTVSQQWRLETNYRYTSHAHQIEKIEFPEIRISATSVRPGRRPRRYIDPHQVNLPPGSLPVENCYSRVHSFYQ